MITQDIISPHRTHLIAESCYRLDELDVPDIVHVGPHQAGQDGPAGLCLTASLTEGFTGRTGERSPPSLAGVSGPREDLEENCVLELHQSHTAATSLLLAVLRLTVTLSPATANRHCSSISVFWSGPCTGQSPEGERRYNFVKCSDHTT